MLLTVALNLTLTLTLTLALTLNTDPNPNPNPNPGQIRGFIERLRSVPPEVVEAKQRAIERVRHQLLYDPTGARPDAFSMMLRELVRVLPPQPGIGKQPSEVPRRRRRALAVDT